MSFLPRGGALPAHRLFSLFATVIIVAGLPSVTLARAVPPGMTGSPAWATATEAYASLEREIEADETGVAQPVGVAWNAQDEQLLVLDAARPGSGVRLTLFGGATGTVPIEGAATGTQVTHDATRDRLVAVDPQGATVTSFSTLGARHGRATRATLGLVARGLRQVDGAAAHDGALWILDGTGRAAFRIDPDASGAFRAAGAQRVDLAGLGADLRGLAIDPATGHLMVFAPATSTLWEVDPSGTAMSKRDLSGIGLDDVRAMTIAPTADPTDGPAESAVYIADAGTAQGVGAGIYEVALAAPQLSAAALVAPQAAATLVRTINTGSGSTWNPDSPDPSGLAFIPASETELPLARRDRLVSADGEVEETTGAGWRNVNVWFAPRNGSVQTSTMNTTTASPSNKEPVGVAYDSIRNHLYISRDASNGRIWVHNPSTNAVIRYFNVTGPPYNNGDAEGLAFDSANNILYMVDAIKNDLVKVRPGPNGVIGTGSDDVVVNYDLRQYGHTEPEGLDVHPVTGNIWVVSNSTSQPMLEVTPNGALVQSVSIQAANPRAPAGVAIAPPSDGSGGYNVYVADRGIDNNPQPNENDGKIYEFNVGAPPPNQPPVANPDSYSTMENTPLNVPAPGVLQNDNDPNGDTLTAIKNTDPANGTLTTFNSDGSFTYTPDPDTTGPDSFTYHANDGQADSNITTVTITVNPGGGGTPQTFNPSDDAYVKEAVPGETFGTSDPTALHIYNAVNSGSPEQWTYLKFTTTIAGTGKLQLFVTQGTVNFGDVYDVGDAWSEATLTWTNRPLPLGAVLDATDTFVGGWAEWDLGTLPAGTHSFVVAGTGSAVRIFASSETANPPQLVITPP